MAAGGLDAGAVALALLLLVHGSIHGLGVAKAFRPLAVPALPPVARPLGLLWLAAGALLVVASLLVFAGSRGWWIAAAVGVLSSQVAIASAWGAARFGTLPNLVLLVPIVLAVASHGR